MTDILVVGGELIDALSIQETLEGEGYHTTAILNGEDAVHFAFRETPHLIILDTPLPGMDGYEVTRQLRDHPKSMHIPIIMISAYDALADRVHALELGVDCYIPKPFHRDELIALVARQLHRVQQNSLSPLTKLPGGLQLEKAIHAKLNSLQPWSLLYLDFDHFKAYNDSYGFLAGNRMIVLLGHVCKRIVFEYGNEDDFVGHVGGDDFVIMTTPDRVEILHEHILACYKEESVALYRPEDLACGFICGLDRKRRPYQAPLLSLSVAVITNKSCSRSRYSADTIGTLAAEAKLKAKLSNHNFFQVFLPQSKGYTEYAHARCSLAMGNPPRLLAVDHAHGNNLSLRVGGALAKLL
ncbi:MAG: response regulator [Ktedonobacteraceae bacterium]|nr:response regulator [Ktedonobacteraceae bacterium]